MNCSNCNTVIKKKFCPDCGQKWTGETTTFMGLLLESIQVVFSLEKSAFATFIRVLYQPKRIVDNYYNGFKALIGKSR